MEVQGRLSAPEGGKGLCHLHYINSVQEESEEVITQFRWSQEFIQPRKTRHPALQN